MNWLTHPLLLTAIETRDSLAFCVYADWLDEHGEDGEGWRLLGESGKWPMRGTGTSAVWCNGGRLNGDHPEDLPQEVFFLLGSRGDYLSLRKWFDDDTTALTAAATAYARVLGRVTK